MFDANLYRTSVTLPVNKNPARTEVAQFSVIDAGSRHALETMVFVHGFGGRAHYWSHQLEHFQDSYRVIAPDLRGHGLSDAPTSGFSVVDLTTNKVLSTERKQKLQLPLTANELQRATDLIFADAEERRLLNTEYKRITGKELTSVSQLNVKAFVFDAESLPERLNPASKQCGLHRCAQVLLYTHASVVFEVSPIVNLSKGIVTQTIGF